MTKDSTSLTQKAAVKDSVRIIDSVVVRHRDSITLIPKSDITGDVSSPCDSTGLKPFDMYLGAGHHRVRVWSDGQVLHVKSSVDSLVSRISTTEVDKSRLEHRLREVSNELSLWKDRYQVDKEATIYPEFKSWKQRIYEVGRDLSAILGLFFFCFWILPKLFTLVGPWWTKLLSLFVKHK